MAISEGHLPVVSAIIRKDPSSVNFFDLNRTSLLMIAVESVLQAKSKGYGISIVKLLVEYGLKPTHGMIWRFR